MEDLIPFLIIIISGIISFFASSRKKKSNKQEEETFAFNSESNGYQEEYPNGQQPSGEDEDSRFSGETIEDRKKELTREEKEPAVEEPRPKEEKKETKRIKPRVSAPKTKQKEKSKIEVIKDRFDPEKAIIYSEIINRKYF